MLEEHDEEHDAVRLETRKIECNPIKLIEHKTHQNLSGDTEFIWDSKTKSLNYLSKVPRHVEEDSIRNFPTIFKVYHAKNLDGKMNCNDCKWRKLG